MVMNAVLSLGGTHLWSSVNAIPDSRVQQEALRYYGQTLRSLQHTLLNFQRDGMDWRKTTNILLTVLLLCEIEVRRAEHCPIIV